MTVILVVILAVVVGGIIVAVFGWDRYRGGGAHGGAAPSEGARPTTEVFIDPDTGQRMRVWFDERTGQREYHSE
ncbi:MAG TPA: hypothetical protein VG520_04785 [Candidatus Dormibacteraeota bacterium]|jgi:hypothetical protein|nr:hypothetical protein [Candidatus Dormibacteraeota bacterium]